MAKNNREHRGCDLHQSVKRLKNEGKKMQILYNAKTGLLYLRLDDREQEVINKRLSDDIVLDMSEDDKIVGIEIIDASRHLNLEGLLPVGYSVLANTIPLTQNKL